MIHTHNAATHALDRQPPQAAAIPALAAVASVAFLLAPRAAPGYLAMIAVAPIAALVAAGRTALAPLRTPLAVAGLVFGVYITINAAWSLDLQEAYGKVLFFWTAFAVVTAAVCGLPSLGTRQLERLQRMVLTGAVIGGGLLLIEVLTGSLIARLLFSYIPAMQPDPKHLRVADGWVTFIEPYMLNRSVGALCLLLWPCLLMLRTLTGKATTRWAGPLLVLAAMLTVFCSDHATSVIAITLGTLAYVAMLRAAPAVRVLTAVVWTVAVLFCAPIASLAYEHGLHRAEWLPQTARNRIILWHVTAEETRKAPLLGIGVASTREIDAARAPTAVRPEGYGYALRTGRHAHSIFLQTWYELGGLGALLLLAMGLAGIRVLWILPAADQPTAFAAFATAASIGASSWGMWQTWFMASYGICIVLLALALEGARRARLAPH